MTNLFDKSNPDGILPRLQKLETRLGLPESFCEALLNEDDWSFIIKIHALIEGALTHALVASIGVESMRGIFSRLDTSSPRTGKVEFAKALDLLSSEDRASIRYLSELRNDLVHKVQNVSFDLKAHVRSLDKDQRKKFLHNFGYWETSIEEEENEHAQWQHVLDNPKVMIWKSILLVLATLAVEASKSELRREKVLIELETLDLLKEEDARFRVWLKDHMSQEET